MSHRRLPRHAGVLVHQILASALVTVALLTGGAAHAQDDEAKARDDAHARDVFRIAEAHYAVGEYEDAARRFSEAYVLSGRTNLLYNIYLSYRDAQLDPLARDALAAFLKANPNHPEQVALQARLARYESTNGPSQPFDAEAASRRPSTPPAAQTQAQAEAAGDADEGSTAATESVSADTSSTAKPLPIAPIVVMGAGGAALIAGVVTGIMTMGAYNELASACPSNQCDPTDATLRATRDRGAALGVVTDVLIPIGVVAAAAGVVLFVVMSGGSAKPAESAPEAKPPATTASLACGPTGCQATIAGRF